MMKFLMNRPNSMRTCKVNATAQSPRFGRLLLADGAGIVGQKLRLRLQAYCDALRLSDHPAMTSDAAEEEVAHLSAVSADQLCAPVVGHTLIDGMSDKQSSWWGNRHAKHLGFRPQDSSDAFRANTVARQPHIDSTDPVAIFQGGGFVKVALHGA